MFFLCKPLSNRRQFLTRLALACAGAVMVPSAIVSKEINRVFANGEPNIGPNQFKVEPCIAQRQTDVMFACQWVAQKLGVLRGSTNITHYSPDHREVLMDWTMILPDESNITNEMHDFAKAIIGLVERTGGPPPPPWGGQGCGG